MEIDEEVVWYYNQGRDVARLGSAGKLEAERTRRIIKVRLPPGPQRVIDIGGGGGAYAFWLAELGHAVSLVDPISIHIDQARGIERETNIRLAGIHQAVADALPADDDQFDVALLLGPLYHLLERADRIQALREARRVLKPGGLLFAAVITRYAWATRGLFQDWIHDNEYWEITGREMSEGRHLNPGRRRGLFTTAYFHLPEELRIEVAEAGFINTELIAIESVFSLIPDFDKKWQDDSFRSRLLGTIEVMESEPSILGLAGHVIGFAQRPRLVSGS